MAQSKSDLFLLLKKKNTDSVSDLTQIRSCLSDAVNLLVECTNIPEDKRRIAMPKMVRECSQIKETAHEIPPYDPKANVEILTRREAPELLKITAGRNGPKGASWAQKLDMGWTISSQMCLNWVGGPVHISAHHTTMEHLEKSVTSCPRNVQERYAEKGEIRVNLFQ